MEPDDVIKDIIDSAVSGELEGKIEKLNNLLVRYGFQITPLQATLAETAPMENLDDFFMKTMTILLDELSVAIGDLRAMGVEEFQLRKHQIFLMEMLHAISTGRDISMKNAVSEAKKSISEMRTLLPVVDGVIVPSGNPAAIKAHRVRVLATKAKLGLTGAPNLPAGTIAYLDELKQMFFLLARYLNKMRSTKELAWKPKVD